MMTIIGILALIFVILYFGGWGIQTFIKYTVAIAVFVYGGIALILMSIAKALVRRNKE
ncbi:hypothetical protein MEPL4_4c00440 [Melissococcus plutonius]|uniref:hypothetical protein n=2 Tax=Melissococcus plutonius TaxID=33970 RepID=UPI000669BB5B|nr:hypothetical protein [Melissococcus plutonius]KMT23455.1 hypothetical protein MEPL2_43p00370 [Melissococcus plutonius]KMT25213.1 hypothetical protein MEPL2_2c07710 [Melissococcus plutonius]KMT26849.1 hypothetical protein MEPL1_4c00440 [Melissococcus plutonius]KMT28861.1 hypothetical protein MEPL4_4c00440 [Melissococcus plutonius]KMT31917.1 hypothetical protein MEPL7_2c07650 [Melissococcus plutonius]